MFSLNVVDSRWDDYLKQTLLFMKRALRNSLKKDMIVKASSM